jgi:hypothetical protein
MKKIILLSATLLFMSGMAEAQNIVAAIAKKSTSCNSTDLGYQIYYGDAKTYELEKQAKAEVKSDNPGWENVETKDNIDWGTPMGDYVVVISASTTNSSGCTRGTFGIGFGEDRASALKDAKKHLTARNWSWSESKHGYKIVHEKRY